MDKRNDTLNTAKKLKILQSVKSGKFSFKGKIKNSTLKNKLASKLS